MFNVKVDETATEGPLLDGPEIVQVPGVCLGLGFKDTVGILLMG